MPKTCELCGNSLDLLKPGRVPRFCATRCRVAFHRASIPAEMRSRDRWVRWTPSKRPIQIDGSPASSTDAGTWTSYARVRSHLRKGFVLGEGIGCIDLDHCLVDGRPNKAARDLLSRLPETYIEVSPSGDGLHVFGLLPEGAGVRTERNGLAVEIYSIGRYMTVTGRRLPGCGLKLGDLSKVAI